jgi:hypothetical protein
MPRAWRERPTPGPNSIRGWTDRTPTGQRGAFWSEQLAVAHTPSAAGKGSGAGSGLTLARIAFKV